MDSENLSAADGAGYTEINSATVDSWVENGWEWGRPLSHEEFENAKNGEWNVLLTPTKYVPKGWFCPFEGAKILGLASGGGQQMPVFTALGAVCTVLDYSQKQLESEKLVAQREGYEIETVRADMTKPLPFEDGRFDLIFHPVSNCYIKDVFPVWRECFRVLKPGGILLAGLDNGIAYAFDEDTWELKVRLPFDPLSDKELFKKSIERGDGIQFSHTLEEQVGGQLKAGFLLTDIFEDVDTEGKLREFNVPTFIATRAIKNI